MRRMVVRLLWLEGCLVVAGAGLLALRLRWHSLRWQEVFHPDWHNTLWGVLAALFMLALGVAGSLAAQRWQGWRFLHRWVLQVSPLIARMRWWEMVLLSLLAGFGEEMLFRGALQGWLGIWVASGLFAIAHVWRWDSDGVKMMLVYLIYSLMLGWLYHLTQNLWSCCVAHTLYDLVALSWIRHWRAGNE